MRMTDDASLKSILDAEAAVQPVGAKRRMEYNRLGSTPEAMIIALWERVVEGRLTATDALQVIRVGVKDALPKEACELLF